MRREMAFVMAESNSTDISPEEKQFVLELIRDARLLGILEIEYKALRIRLSPAAAQTAQRDTYYAQASGTNTGWSTILPKAGR